MQANTCLMKNLNVHPCPRTGGQNVHEAVSIQLLYCTIGNDECLWVQIMFVWSCPVCLSSVYLTSPHMTKPPRSSPLFLHTASNQKLKLGKVLRMKLDIAQCELTKIQTESNRKFKEDKSQVLEYRGLGMQSQVSTEVSQTFMYAHLLKLCPIIIGLNEISVMDMLATAIWGTENSTVWSY